MSYHIYFDGQLFKTQQSNITQIYQELKQTGFYNDLLIIFDDKKVYQGNEQTSQIQGRLNIYRSKFIVEEIEENLRIKKKNEIYQLEIKRLEQKNKRTEDSLRNDLQNSIQLADLEIQQLKEYILKLESQEVDYVNKLENLRKQNFELKYLVEKNKDTSQRQESDSKVIAQQNVISNLGQQITNLKTDNLRLKNEIKQLQDKSVISSKKVEINNDSYQMLLQQHNQMEQLRNAKDDEIRELRQKNQQLMKDCERLEFELLQPKGPSQTSIIRVQTLQNDLNKKIEALNDELLIERKKLAEEMTRYDLQRDDNFKLNKDIVELKQSCQNIKRILDQKKEELEKYQDEKSLLEADLKSKEESISQYRINAANQEEKIKKVKIKSEKIVSQLQNQIQECERTIKTQKEQIQQKDQLIREYEIQLLQLKQTNAPPQEVEKVQNRLNSEQQQKNQLQSSMTSLQKQLNLNIGFLEDCIQVNDVVKEIDNDNQNIAEQIRRNKQILEDEVMQKKKAMEDKKNLRKLQYEQEQKLKALDQAHQRSKLEADLRKRCKELSEMQICFIIDTTDSMKPYFDQALQCVKECVENINNKMNRQIQWAIVTYKDFDWNKPYQYQNFTRSYEELLNFSKLIKCEGGADTAEDLEGALQIVLDSNKVKWTQSVKLCILITDSPCHGRNFSTISSDDHPNSDIKPSLQKLVDQQISLVGVKLNPIGYADCLTTQMYQEFEKIYKQNNSEEHLLIFDLQKQQTQNLWKEFANTVSQATFKVATANKSTKSKLKDDNKVGNMQALIQILKNPKQFDQDIHNRPRNVDLDVIQIELKPDIQEEIQHLQSPKIHLIQYKNEIKWQCRMSSKPFAQGQNKSVYVMKKQNNNDEVYVLKGQLNGQAYPTLDAANLQCFSHLVAKYLMEEFKKQLQHSKKECLEVSYSDILILKESNNQFWIAERYFEGTFEKYNNNYGYINPSSSDINSFAQAFSHFTLCYCKLYQIVLDVQGVGNHWTDPAINTRDGKFDDTDMGEEGISMYITNKEIDVFKNIGNKYML